MIVKMTILSLLGSSDDKEKEKIGVARPKGPPLSIGCKSLSFGTYKVNKVTPGGMQGSKLINLVSLTYPIYFRATSVHDMI